MKARLKIPAAQLAAIRTDLHRRHAFAHERVGFLTAGVTRLGDGTLLLCARTYSSVADADYRVNPNVGVEIGPDAIRKALQAAFRDRGSLFHLHTHGGEGRPEFSYVDLESGHEFVPTFFNVVPHMPHGIAVLSDDSARGLFWSDPESPPAYVTEFVQVGAPFRKFGGAA